MTSDSEEPLNAGFSVVPDGDGLAVVLESSSGADRQRSNARTPTTAPRSNCCCGASATSTPC
ncbi:hypothetical protein [Actinosynnema pretiosum]|nr:hypothetical protein [Actinosynnema pretiosum]